MTNYKNMKEKQEQLYKEYFNSKIVYNIVFYFTWPGLIITSRDTLLDVYVSL